MLNDDSREEFETDGFDALVLGLRLGLGQADQFGKQSTAGVVPGRLA
ncbi:hypothetical protein [Streptomyces sp. NPDC049915]